MITFPTLESSSSYDYDALGPPHTANDSSRLHHQNTFQASPQQHDMSIVQNSMSSSFYSPNMFDYSFSQSLNSQVGFPLETNLQNYHPQPSVPQLMSGDYSPSQNELVYNLTSLESFPSSYLASGSNSIEFNPIIEARANLSNVAITQGPISQSPIGQTAPNFNINRGGIDTRVDNRSNATFEVNPNTQLIPTNLNSFDYQEDNQFTTNIQYPNLLTKMKTLQPNLYESIELRKNMETIPENVNNLAYSHNNFAPKLDQIAILQSNNNQMENQVKNFERLRIQNQPQQVPNETPSCYSASSSVSSTHPIAIMDSSLEAKMLHLQPFPPQGPSVPSPALNYYDALNASTSRSISTGSEFTPTEVTHQKSNIPFGDSSLSINVANDIEIKPKKHTRRRLLPRSKKGCWICRIKHMKCDEVRPICSNCSKFGIECDYSSQKPPYVFDKKLRQAKLLSISLIRKQNQMALKKSEKASYVK